MNPHSLPYHLRHQALFVGYAPAENPTIAVAVVVEHGGYGASSAGPIARKIFDAWLLGKMPEPDPADADAIAPTAVAATTTAPVALSVSEDGVVVNTPAPVSPAFAVGALSAEALAREAAKGHANAPTLNARRDASATQAQAANPAAATARAAAPGAGADARRAPSAPAPANAAPRPQPPAPPPEPRR
jgi:penicillin-binding protein 2